MGACYSALAVAGILLTLPPLSAGKRRNMGRFSSCPPSYLFAPPRRSAPQSPHRTRPSRRRRCIMQSNCTAHLWSARGCENLAGNLSRSGKQQHYQTSPNHVRAINGRPVCEPARAAATTAAVQIAIGGVSNIRRQGEWP